MVGIGVMAALISQVSATLVESRMGRERGQHPSAPTAQATLIRRLRRALEEANRKKMKSICFLGRDGGFTKGVATLDLWVPGTVTARIQECHTLLFHVLCEAADGELPR